MVHFLKGFAEYLSERLGERIVLTACKEDATLLGLGGGGVVDPG